MSGYFYYLYTGFVPNGLGHSRIGPQLGENGSDLIFFNQMLEFCQTGRRYLRLCGNAGYYRSYDLKTVALCIISH
jgi:hypothetical protein